jgi:DNA-binding GntR family transcriptional regulator
MNRLSVFHPFSIPVSVMNKPVEPRNLSAHAYDALVDLIRCRKLKAGSPIIETRLSAALGVSRTPLREALQRLEGEGIIEKGAGRSYRVRRVELEEYLQTFKIREVLEIEAAVMSLGRIPSHKIQKVLRELEESLILGEAVQPVHWFTDDDVHGLYVNHCGNDVLRRFLRLLRTTTRLFDIDKIPPRVAKDYIEHKKIVDALEQKNEKLVVRAIRAHFKSVVADALSL